MDGGTLSRTLARIFSGLDIVEIVVLVLWARTQPPLTAVATALD